MLRTDGSDGGPAFPPAVSAIGDEGSDGMSLRDWFAGQALAAIGTWMPAHGGSDLGSKAAMQSRALWAYEQADAMLAAREAE